jgi:hypothetical protein
MTATDAPPTRAGLVSREPMDPYALHSPLTPTSTPRRAPLDARPDSQDPRVHVRCKQHRSHGSTRPGNKICAVIDNSREHTQLRTVARTAGK